MASPTVSQSVQVDGFMATRRLTNRKCCFSFCFCGFPGQMLQTCFKYQTYIKKGPAKCSKLARLCKYQRFSDYEAEFLARRKWNLNSWSSMSMAKWKVSYLIENTLAMSMISWRITFASHENCR